MPSPEEIVSRTIRDQVHSGNYYIYPKLDVPVSLISDGVAYVMGPYVEIIPANTITTSFWIIGAVIFDASSGVEYILDIATGPALSESDLGTLCFKYGITGGTTASGAFQADAFQADAFDMGASQSANIIPSQDPVFPVAVKVKKNTRISMRVGTSVGNYNCKAKIKYKL